VFCRRTPLLAFAVALAAFAGAACSGAVRNADRIANDPGYRLIDSARVGTMTDAALAALAGAQSAADKNDRAVFLIRAGRLLEAEAELNEALKLEPALLPAGLNLARLYAAAGDAAAARKICADLARAPGLTVDALYRAALEMDPARSPERRLLLETLANDLRHYPANLNLGADALYAGDYARATRAYDRALELRPDGAEALFGLAYLRYLARDFDRAAALFDASIKNGVREPQACRLAAQSHFEREDYLATRARLDSCPDRLSDREAAALYGETLLRLDYRADVRPLLARFTHPEDQRLLLQKWFGVSDIEGLESIRREIELLY
jgi:Tfp pilus assembly protein PilF